MALLSLLRHALLLAAASATCGQDCPGPVAEVGSMLSVSNRRLLLSGRVEPSLLIARFAKCGSTYAKNVLATAVSKSELVINLENVPLAETLNNHTGLTPFKIGLMRNPFNRLVSLWGYYAREQGNFFGTEEPNVRSQFVPSKNASLQQMRECFAAWLRHYSSEQLGLSTFQFVAKYIRSDIPVADSRHIPSKHPEIMMEDINLLDHVAPANAGLVLHELREKDIVNCWAFTENLESSLTHCLEEFERSGGVVHWANFNLANQRHSKHSHRRTSELQLGWNVSCDEIFGDDASLRELVDVGEQRLLEFFDYPKGCS